MSTEFPGEEHESQPTNYIRVSQLAKILGWKRTSIYYWLHRCEIEIVVVAGHQLIPVHDLSRLVMTLQQARDMAAFKREQKT